MEKGTLTLLPHKTKNEKEAVFELNQELSDLLYQLTADLPREYFIFGHRCKPGITPVEDDLEDGASFYSIMKKKDTLLYKLQLHILKADCKRKQ